MSYCQQVERAASRRQFLQRTSAGFGWLALQALHAETTGGKRAQAAETVSRSPLAPKKPHFAAKAKRVIFLFMAGGPSHVDTFDWKPELKRVGTGGQSRLLGPVFDYAPSGKSGLMIANVFPELSKQADHLCLLNGVKTNNPAHQQATVAIHTGSENFVRPSLGAWVTYGLGTEGAELPAFVTLDPLNDLGGAMNYGSAFLPATFQGTRLGGSGGVANIANRRLSERDQRRQLDFVQSANRRLLNAVPGNPELEGLIESYELAFKMQASVPESLDLDNEPDAMTALYGLDNDASRNFGRQCLLARRLAEKGVRFIQLTSIGWDHHNNLREHLSRNAEAIDRPIAGLIADLRQRGMLDETLIVWGGEFGRTARDDKGDSNGRGHANRGYTMWMAGGGVKGGLRYGATDELGENAVEGIMDTHDVHATILHLLGLDHEGLTFRHAGRDFRLTDVHGKVATGIIA